MQKFFRAVFAESRPKPRNFRKIWLEHHAPSPPRRAIEGKPKHSWNFAHTHFSCFSIVGNRFEWKKRKKFFARNLTPQTPPFLQNFPEFSENRGPGVPNFRPKFRFGPLPHGEKHVIFRVKKHRFLTKKSTRSCRDLLPDPRRKIFRKIAIKITCF